MRYGNDTGRNTPYAGITRIKFKVTVRLQFTSISAGESPQRPCIQFMVCGLALF